MTNQTAGATYRARAPAIVSLLLMAMNGIGCESTGHSQGLLEQNRSGGGVNNPYIVRDPAQRKRPQPAPATQPAETPDSPM